MISTPTGAAATFNLDFLVVELALAEHLAEFLAGFGLAGFDGGGEAGRWRREQGVQHLLLGGVFGPVADFLGFPLTGQLDGGIHQVADDAVYLPAHVADLGELGGFHLDERRLGESGQAAGDLGLADARGADHQDVLRRDLALQGFADLHPSPAVAQRDGDGALRRILADDVFVQFLDDLAGGHLGHVRKVPDL